MDAPDVETHEVECHGCGVTLDFSESVGHLCAGCDSGHGMPTGTENGA
jgi:hypothetical protein